MATRDDGEQRRDQWGGGLQNEYGRILGRIEEKVDQLASSATNRDTKLSELTERVRANAHTANNAAQTLTNTVTLLEKSSKRTEAKVDKLDTRVGALEGPVRKAVAARMQRRKMWVKIVSVASGVTLATWAVAEPIWHAIAPIAVQRWFNVSPPTH